MDSKIEIATLSTIWPYLVIFVVAWIGPILLLSVLGCDKPSSGIKNITFIPHHTHPVAEEYKQRRTHIKHRIYRGLTRVDKDQEKRIAELEKNSHPEKHTHPIAVEHARRIKILEEKLEDLAKNYYKKPTLADDLDCHPYCRPYWIKQTSPKEHSIVRKPSYFESQKKAGAKKPHKKKGCRHGKAPKTQTKTPIKK